MGGRGRKKKGNGEKGKGVREIGTMKSWVCSIVNEGNRANETRFSNHSDRNLVKLREVKDKTRKCMVPRVTHITTNIAKEKMFPE